MIHMIYLIALILALFNQKTARDKPCGIVKTPSHGSPPPPLRPGSGWPEESKAVAGRGLVWMVSIRGLKELDLKKQPLNRPQQNSSCFVNQKIQKEKNVYAGKRKDNEQHE